MGLFRRRLLIVASVVVLSASIVQASGPASAEDGLLPGTMPETGGQFAQAMADPDDVNDPLEPLNRGIFAFNEAFLQYVLGPVARAYKENLPEPVRTAVNNVLSNLASPVYFANELLQGKPDKAMEVFGRFLLNTTAGMGGIRDVAADHGWERRKEDFGQTLGVWGVGEGFYLVIPIFGPSNPRDAIGKLVVDSYLDPFGMWADNTDREYAIYSRTVVDGVDIYAGIMDELDEIRKTSIDYYAAVRSMYRQRRQAEIRDGRPGDLPPIPDISYEAVPGGVATAR